MLYEAIAAAVAVLVIAGLIYLLERDGKKSAEADQMKQVLDDIHTANMARNRLRNDSSYAQRVRKLFTR